MPKRQRATFHVKFPVSLQSKKKQVVNPLRWWNTHYKSMHEWEGGRIEVRFDRRLRDFDSLRATPSGDTETSSEEIDRMVYINCPYCDKPCHFHIEAVDKVKGNIHCPFCKKQYGVHPSGQLFVVADVDKRVVTASSRKEEVLDWLSDAISDLDADVFVPRKGDEGVEIDIVYLDFTEDNKTASRMQTDTKFDDFVEQLEDAGYEYRRLE